MFHKNSSIEKSHGKEGEEEDGGSIKIFRQFFLSQCPNKLLGIPLVCQYFRISKNFIIEMAMPRFSVEIFCLALSKNFVGGPFRPFCVTTNFWYRKKFMEKRGEEGEIIKIFRQTFFCLSAEKFVGDSFSRSLFSGIETFYT